MDNPKKEPTRAPEMLLWEIPFEFLSHLSLDECSSRIHEINANKSFFSATRKIYLSSVEQHKILFHLSEPGGKLGEGWAVGYLEEKPDEITLISGKAGISPEVIITLFMVGVLGLILAIMSFRSFGTLILSLMVMGSIIFAIFQGIKHIRSSLVNQLRDLLEENILQ